MAGSGKRRHGGFTYLSLMIVVAIIALTAAASLKLGSVLQRSNAEQELLDIGAAYSDALKSYADATPAGLPPQPPSLKELLKDPRLPGTRRHLRKIFVDPMTGRTDWGIVYLGDKTGVLAVYSLSDAKPVKIGNFPQRFASLEGKNRISDWKFVMAEETPGAAGAPLKAGAANATVPVIQQPGAAPPAAPVAPVAVPPAAAEAPPAPKEEVVPPSVPGENPVPAQPVEEPENTQK